MSQPLNKKLTKFIEFLILSQLDKTKSNIVQLALYVDLSIKTHQIKYMDRAKDLIDYEMSKFLQQNNQKGILQVLLIIKKYSSCQSSEVA